MVTRSRACTCRNIRVFGSLASLISQFSYMQRTTVFSPLHSPGDELQSKSLPSPGSSLHMSSGISPSESHSPIEKIPRHKRKHGNGATVTAGRLRHSYLKLMLDAKVWDELHSMTLSVRDQYQALFNSQASSSVTSDSRDLIDDQLTQCNPVTLSTDMAQRPDVCIGKWTPALNPRSKQSLHLTFFFGGQVLCALPEDELTQWHHDIQERIQRIYHAYSFKDGQGVKIPSDSLDTYTITFQRLRLFPPTRNSLIVAEFDVSPSLNNLYEDVVHIALSSKTTNDMLAKVVNRKHQRWLAHVTLADVPRSWRKKELYLLETILEQTNMNLCTQVHGLTMGGPCPQQKELDWNFYFPHCSTVENSNVK